MVYPKKLKDNKHCNLDCATCVLPKENCKYMGHNLAIDEFTKEIRDRASVSAIEQIIRNNAIVEDMYICVIPEHYFKRMAEAISKHITKGL